MAQQAPIFPPNSWIDPDRWWRFSTMENPSRCWHLHGHKKPPSLITTGWWFQIFFIFIPIWGNDPIWRAYFSDGLKPPTRPPFQISPHRPWSRPGGCRWGWSKTLMLQRPQTRRQPPRHQGHWWPHGSPSPLTKKKRGRVGHNSVENPGRKSVWFCMLLLFVVLRFLLVIVFKLSAMAFITM